MKHIIATTIVSGAAICLPASQASAQYDAARPGSSLYAQPVKNDAAQAFIQSGDAYVHWLTSMKCPVETSGVPLNVRRQYTIQGHSVACSYGDGKTIRTSFNFRPFDRDETPSTMVERISASIEEGGKIAAKNDVQEVRMDFAGEPIACVKVTYDYQPGSSGVKISESIMACNMLTWALSVNWTGRTSEKARGDALIEDFLKKQQATRQHLRSCIAEGKKRREMQPSSATGLSIAVDRFGYQEKGNPCFSGNISAREGRDPLLILVWPGNSDTPTTLHSVAQNGVVNRQPVFQLQDMWATVPASERGPGGYVMVKQDADGTVSSYGGYLKIVSSGSIYENYLKVLSGELKAQTSSKPNKAGGSNITIG